MLLAKITNKIKALENCLGSGMNHASFAVRAARLWLWQQQSCLTSIYAIEIYLFPYPPKVSHKKRKS